MNSEAVRKYTVLIDKCLDEIEYVEIAKKLQQ
jgi:hypothetical protein